MWRNENAAKLQLIFRSTKSEAQFCASTTDKAIQKKAPSSKQSLTKGNFSVQTSAGGLFSEAPDM